jgi:hypothetical protein
VISTNADAVLIEIRNPAVEYASLFPSSGAGIMGMTERVRLAGGRLDHGILNGEFSESGTARTAIVTTPVRVAIVDDDALVRAGLVMMFGRRGWYLHRR